MLGAVRGCEGVGEGVVLLYVDEQHLTVTTQMGAYRRPAAYLSIVYLKNGLYQQVDTARF
ncbi:MAG: hypothetical protein H6Q70_2274 [Firmicutes bacterium]|nr:hypothetical protein [Bacillota bacterium]